MLSIFEVWFHPQNDKQVNKVPRRSRKGTLGGPVTLQTKVLPFDSTDPWASPDPQKDIDKDPPLCPGLLSQVHLWPSLPRFSSVPPPEAPTRATSQHPHPWVVPIAMEVDRAREEENSLWKTLDHPLCSKFPMIWKTNSPGMIH